MIFGRKPGGGSPATGGDAAAATATTRRGFFASAAATGAALLLLLVAGCGGGGDSAPGSEDPGSQAGVATITGRVTDTDGVGAAGVTVRFGTGSGVTDEQGNFLFTVPAGTAAGAANLQFPIRTLQNGTNEALYYPDAYVNGIQLNVVNTGFAVPATSEGSTTLISGRVYNIGTIRLFSTDGPPPPPPLP